MAVLQGKFIGKRGASLKNAFYVRTWRGQLVVCAWPRKQKIKQPPAVLERREKFRQAQKLAQYLIPEQQMLAREASEGTPLLPRDLLTAAMYGRLWAISFADGRTIYSEGQAHDVSLNLDVLPLRNPVTITPPTPSAGPNMEDFMPRLTKSGADLKLSPLNGNTLPIDGTDETVPAAGVTLAATGLTIDTDHFVYAYMDGAVMKLEASTTGHAVDATTGIEIKAGDATRTLVGLARPITGPAWADTAAQRFVISWFNRRTITADVLDTTQRSITSLVAVEVSTTYRAEFLTWADEMPLVAIVGWGRNTSIPNAWEGQARIDTVAIGGRNRSSTPGNTYGDGVSAVGAPTSIAEGYHYSTLYGLVNTGTGQYNQIRNITQLRG